MVNAWGFRPKEQLNDLDPNKVKELMNFVGFNKVSIRNDEVIKESPEIYFDFNAVAKGYGIDVISRFLESKGVKNYLVEIGGKSEHEEEKPEGKSWVVQLDNPNTDGSRSAYDIIRIKDKAMASSGTTGSLE